MYLFLSIFFSILVTIQMTIDLAIKANQQRGQNEHSKTWRADVLFTGFSQQTDRAAPVCPQQPYLEASLRQWRTQRNSLYARATPADSMVTQNSLLALIIQRGMVTFGRHSSFGMVNLKLF